MHQEVNLSKSQSRSKHRCGGRCLSTTCKTILMLTVILAVFGHRLVGSHYYDMGFVMGGKYLATFLPVIEDEVNNKPYDYEDIHDSWVTHPDKLDWADIVPPLSGLSDGQQTARAAVFFVYPTGYFGFKMNSPSNPAFISDPLGAFGDIIADITAGMVHGSIYNGVGRIFTPRYRQLSGWGFMLPESDERRQRALRLALDDVGRAFDHFLQVNAGSPFILAGHSQGSILLCQLLRERFHSKLAKQDLLYKQFVAAYLIGANIGHEDCGELVRICENPNDLRCFVHFNVVVEGGDRTKFLLAPIEKNLTCVNPLSFKANNDQIEARLNPGSRPFLRPIRAVQALTERFVFGTSKLINLMSPLEQGLFSARCHQGVVWVNNHPDATGFWTTGVFPGMNVHGGESSMFYLSIRLNAKSRLDLYHADQKDSAM